MIELLQYDNEHVKIYVTSVLYNLFSDSRIREEAKDMGMSDLLQSCKNDLDERYERQIDFLLDLLDRMFLCFQPTPAYIK